MLAATFGVGQVLYSIFWFFLIFVEIWLMISIFIDIFRSHDLKGWAKALWVLLVLAVPFVGILAYVIVRGDKMRAHQVQEQRLADRSLREYVRHAAGTGPVADELTRLAQLRREGDISEAEYELLKQRLIEDAAEVGSDHGA